MAAIVESSHDAIVSRTLDGTILTWNPGAEKLFGYTAAEIVGRNIEILWPPELTTDMRRRHTLLVRGLAGPAYETVRVAKDGRRVHVSTSPTPIRDSSGNVCGVSTIVRDISERKIAEQNLSESRERLEWVLEATGIGLWLNPLPLSELNWDSRTCELFFLPPGARPTVEWFWKRLHPEDREPTRLAVEAALRDKTLYAIDHRVVSPKTGEIRWIRSAGKAIYDASGTAIRFDGINYDITDEKQAESERLDHTVRQRDALVREVHHRIKNSLQGVVGLLRQKIRKNPSIAPDIEETISQLQSVALVYGLQETRPDGLVNLAEITDAICSSAGNLIGGRLERIFERQSQGPACVVAREAVSVAVALNELVINALKHQPARAGQKHVRIILRETADEAEIRISNRGHLPAGFDYHGGRAAGNGLELVRTLLAAPGGTITFNGARGEVEVVLKLSPPLLAERQRPSQGKR
jgi:PAS domain S-box-containing protein